MDWTSSKARAVRWSWMLTIFQATKVCPVPRLGLRTISNSMLVGTMDLSCLSWSPITRRTRYGMKRSLARSTACSIKMERWHMRTKRLPINLPLVAIVAEGFLSRLSFGIISFALPLYAYRLGLSLTEIGLLTSLNLVVALALKAGMGWAADRFGLKRSFAFAIGLRSLVALLLAFAV